MKTSHKAFDIPEPLLIGMSGGQTSGYQLRLFLDHYGGKIDGRRKVVFANTGDEDERTLKFVERVSLEWNVEIIWLEYRFVPFPDSLLKDPKFIADRQRQINDRKDKGLRNALATQIEAVGFPEQAESIRCGREVLNGRNTYAQVNYATASRKREPYQMMLEAREAYRKAVKGLGGIIPCPPQRICTGELKVKCMARFVADIWGISRVDGFYVALALRADEKHRVDSALSRDIEAGIPYFPLEEMGVVAADVKTFWAEQPFQLGMKAYEGNCRLCFMKKKEAKITLIRQRPEAADWWIGWEKRVGDTFRRDQPSYTGLKFIAQHQGQLFPEPDELETVIDCEGGYCSN
jgi:hypothetical protein